MSTIDRRTFLGAAAAAGIGAGAFGQGGQRGSSRARNLIILIADGLSLGGLKLGEMYARQVGRDGLFLTGLMNEPGVRTSLVDTEIAGGTVPDSASTASAFSIGRRCAYRAVSVTPDGATPKPLFRRAREAGMAIGAVTNTSLWDATPAAFFANAPTRDMAPMIAQQMCELRPYVLLGGGGHHFGEPLLRDIHGLSTIRSGKDLDGAARSDGPLFGFFADGSMNFIPDRAEHEPSVPEMADAALGKLGRLAASNGKGFALLIEQAKVDHAAHANDPGSYCREVLEFDDLVRMVRDYQRRHPDTLVLITTDHANANPGLTVYRREGLRRFATVANYRHSHQWISDRFGELGADERSADRLAGLVEEATGATLTDGDRLALKRFVERDRPDPFEEASSLPGVLGSIMANHTGIGWVSPNHTTDHVIALAWGPGSEAMRPMMHNTELHEVSRGALSLAQA